MIIDVHNHVDWYGHNMERFLENMDRYNIDVTWLLTWESPQDEYDPHYIKNTHALGPEGPIAFANTLKYVQDRPDRFVLGYCPDPRRPEAIDLLSTAIDLYGVRVCGELKLRMMYDNPDALRMYRFCGEKGLPVLVHIDYEFERGSSYPRPNYWYGGGIAAFERAIAACPETVFIGHAPGYWAHISDDGQHDKVPYPKGTVQADGEVARLMRKYPNLYSDISGGSGCNALKRDPEYAQEFLLEFQDQILYGRDYFDNQHQEFLDSLDLPQEVLTKIYSGNALRLVPL